MLREIIRVLWLSWHYEVQISCIGVVCLLLLEVFTQNPRSAVAE